jgi:hypothetical protein
MQEITICIIGFIAAFFLYLFAAIVALLYFNDEFTDEIDDSDYYYDDVF